MDRQYLKTEELINENLFKDKALTKELRCKVTKSLKRSSLAGWNEYWNPIEDFAEKLFGENCSCLHTYNEEYYVGDTTFQMYYGIDELSDYVIICPHMGGDVRLNYGKPTVYAGDVKCFLSEAINPYFFKDVS